MKSNVFYEIKISLANEIFKSYEKQFIDYPSQNFLFETPPQGFGHLALPCFQFARFLKKKPYEIALDIQKKIVNISYIERTEIKGAYLNFFLTNQFIEENLFHSNIDLNFGDNDSLSSKTMMVEFSSPNTNKPLHLGHCRNNSLGSCLANIFKSCGANVIKANLVNDRGVHICKSMLAYQLFAQNAQPTDMKGDHFVGDYYVQYNQESKKDPSLETKAKQLLLSWEEGNPETMQLWKQMNQWTIDGFKETYERMNINFDHWYFESETYQGGKDIVEKGLQDGICEKESNGAISIAFTQDKQEVRKILLRADGTSVYMTQDLNTTLQKFKDYALDHCCFVVGDEQDYHFKVLFSILEQLGYDWANRCEHISYGMIELPDGKMKSREGNVVDLDHLLDTLYGLALNSMQERNYQNQDSDDLKLEEIAEIIGQSALKFFILKMTPTKKIIFNAQDSLSFDGMTGPYIQYTHARISSLLKKANMKDFYKEKLDYEWSEEEQSLLVDCMKFAQVISSAGKERNPSLLTQYIYDICRNYNRFYYENQILKENEMTQKARLNLSFISRIVIHKSLLLLDIRPLNRM